MTVAQSVPPRIPPRDVRAAAYRQDIRALTPTLGLLGIVLVVAGIAVAVSLATHSAAPAGDVAVTETDYRISMPATLRAGHHSFAIANDGRQPHEFVLFRTDVPADAVPLDPSGDMNEDSPLVHTVADSGNSLAPSTTRVVSANLSPGHYVAVCNLPAHYHLGMHVDVTVK